MENFRYFKTEVVTVNIPSSDLHTLIQETTVIIMTKEKTEMAIRVKKKSNLNKEQKPQLMHKVFSFPSFTKQELH